MKSEDLLYKQVEALEKFGFRFHKFSYKENTHCMSLFWSPPGSCRTVGLEHSFSDLWLTEHVAPYHYLRSKLLDMAREIMESEAEYD